jgi:hypothetical protein
MAQDRFLIAPINIGLEKDLKPFLIPDSAYAELTNAYVFRGRVRKRFGSNWMANTANDSRLAMSLGSTDGAGAKAGFVPGLVGKIGQQFAIGTEIFTVYQANGAMLSTTGVSAVHTYDTVTGAYNFVGAAINTPVFWYPANPVMGLCNYEIGSVNNQPSYAFDTQFAYLYSGSWLRSNTGVDPMWHGDNLDFFWTTNWNGTSIDQTVLFVTNFQVTNTNGVKTATDDPIWAYNGTIWQNFSTFTRFIPVAKGAGNYVATARIIVPFKDRLLLLNTIEVDPTDTNNISYPQRCRFSQNGSVFDANAWIQNNEIGFQGAGWVDAATQEQIVSAEFIKDRLIVYFERSTWELAYTGNQVLPFVWQKLNTELGSEAMLSSVPFDKVILTIGNTGVHACNGSNVERVDDKIPDEIFSLRNKNEGVKRVAGVRDYTTEMVYWTFPNTSEDVAEIYPDKVLVYNYRTGSWAFNEDCITAWGYFEQQADKTWATANTTWENANYAWDSGVAASQFRQVIAGNQQGFVFIVNAELSTNAAVMQITNMAHAAGVLTLTVMDNTLSVGEYIKITDVVGLITDLTGIYKIQNATVNTITVNVPNFIGIYLGGGLITRVSNLNILSKQWNFYIQEDKNAAIPKIDFLVEKTTSGEVTVDYFPSSTKISLLDGGALTGALLGTGVLETSPYVLYPLEKTQERLWHPMYLQAEGNGVQIKISMNETQMTDPKISSSDFQLHGLVVYASRTSDGMR